MAEAYETERDDTAPAPDGPGLFRHWKRCIETAGRKEEEWRKAGMSVVEKYRDEKRQKQAGKRQHKFNMLWSNTEVQASAIFQGNVQPDIRRRYRTPDPTGKEGATIIERSLAYMADECDYDDVIRRIVQDMLLPGRGVARVRYDYQPGPDGVPVGEKVPVEYVDWRWFRRDPDADRWEDVTWIAFGGQMTRRQLVEAFGRKGREVNLSATDDPEQDKEESEDSEVYRAARVWEIWDKTDRTVKYWCQGYQDGLLAETDPPYDLRGFFPCPRPIYAVQTNDTLIPVPEYEQWRDQAAELNKVTDRIDKVVDAIRVRGVYPASDGAEIARLMQGDDNDLIPVENWPALMEKGGLKDVLQWMPIDILKDVLESLYIQRDSIKQTIYEITGISDILRGATDARETATAQEIKSKFGSLRIERKRGEVNRLCRDLMEMQAEIVAEHFQPQTLSMMTGVQVTPEVMQMLRDDRMRSYRIDVETEDSIQAQSEEEKRAALELLNAIGGMAEGVGAVIQSGLISQQAARAVVMAVVRQFRFGKDVENAMEEGEAEMAQQPPKPDPEAEAAQAKAQAEQMKAQAQVQKTQGDMQLAQAKGQVEMQTLQARSQAEAQKVALEIQVQQQEHALKMAEMQAELQKLAAEVEMAREKGEIDRENVEAKAKAQRAQARRKQRADA
ncbi:hypothetical protein ACFOGJ_16170 [Marinibaculum pumilum]|uniref:Portal protein n=1 Tax=Marinibaculum pumilum TaxID=1766165 RepID=A0ABV7L280_9PROT